MALKGPCDVEVNHQRKESRKLETLMSANVKKEKQGPNLSKYYNKAA